MTFKNRKKLYDYYVKEGMNDKAEAIAKGHSDVLPKEKPKEEKPKSKEEK